MTSDLSLDALFQILGCLTKGDELQALLKLLFISFEAFFSKLFFIFFQIPLLLFWIIFDNIHHKDVLRLSLHSQNWNNIYHHYEFDMAFMVPVMELSILLWLCKSILYQVEHPFLVILHILRFLLLLVHSFHLFLLQV